MRKKEGQRQRLSPLFLVPLGLMLLDGLSVGTLLLFLPMLSLGLICWAFGASLQRKNAKTADAPAPVVPPSPRIHRPDPLATTSPVSSRSEGQRESLRALLAAGVIEKDEYHERMMALSASEG